MRYIAKNVAVTAAGWHFIIECNTQKKMAKEKIEEDKKEKRRKITKKRKNRRKIGKYSTRGFETA